MFDYDNNAKPTDFPIDCRVELHPAMDLWMRGARVGRVVGYSASNVVVDLDALGRTVKVQPRDLKRV